MKAAIAKKLPDAKVTGGCGCPFTFVATVGEKKHNFGIAALICGDAEAVADKVAEMAQ